MSLTDAAFKEAIARDFKFALRRIPYLNTVTRGRSSREFGTDPGWAPKDGCLPSNLGSLERSESRLMSWYYPSKHRSTTRGQPANSSCSYAHVNYREPQRTLSTTKSLPSLTPTYASPDDHSVSQRGNSSLIRPAASTAHSYVHSGLGRPKLAVTLSNGRPHRTKLDDDGISVIRSVTSSGIGSYPTGISEVFPHHSASNVGSLSSAKGSSRLNTTNRRN
ncbi:hypothetical protein Pmar_PMAR001869 [Perkinsus marinus ATCC 50983]|uniref:Uncharacterized protein n=1 Tax=Perkinsus marinus (strain ATCC 50983 / TXsc) TaxID=423536 RepID=C5LFY0_PERM5|nr:hypothetical protein Pmar_PMAR001869 [Perkinsus marinus ATCC 50983]EER04361.1 hypothetical protein Pmar_PMAR001869 [Perkinsus marinus ATCC 50983]|eukprot:XP_002772545.1 hypothetical protein Pmar_PMAR001869 [Perkinsus marinus ATCC 50983]